MVRRISHGGSSTRAETGAEYDTVANCRGPHFPIACLGASAGGLTPCLRIIEKVPRNIALAIVLIRHGRRKPSYLSEIVGQHTEMPALSIIPGLQVEPGRVYISPLNCNLMISGNRFQLRQRAKTYGWPNTITLFLESLATSWPGPVVAVILSGLSADGVAALGAVKAAGGVTIAQQVETARYPDMPLNAIKSGCVDYVLPPAAIARALVKIARSSARARNQVEQANSPLGP